MEAIFIDEVSVLRADHEVSEQIIDAMPNARFGSFACYGILELSADDIRNAGCVFEITQEACPPIRTRFFVVATPAGKPSAPPIPKPYA